MTNDNNTPVTSLTNDHEAVVESSLREQLFAEKAEKYIVCYNSSCPLHQRCLRYDVGAYVKPSQRILTAVNPHYNKAAGGQCDMFADNTPVRMNVGMRHFYDEMPARIARRIKQRLIDHNCRRTYYKYHNGELPITPSMQAFIERVCQEEGWTGALVFEGETVNYVW